MTSEIDRLHAELQEKLAAIRAIDRDHLRDYYNRKRSLQTALIKTHHHVTVDTDPSQPPVRVTGYDLNGAAQRAGLFVELDRLNQVHAPIINERRILRQESKALMTVIRHAEEAQARVRQRGERLH